MCCCMGYGAYCEADSWDFRIGFCLEIMHVNMEVAPAGRLLVPLFCVEEFIKLICLKC